MGEKVIVKHGHAIIPLEPGVYDLLEKRAESLNMSVDDLATVLVKGLNKTMRDDVELVFSMLDAWSKKRKA